MYTYNRKLSFKSKDIFKSLSLKDAYLNGLITKEEIRLSYNNPLFLLNYLEPISEINLELLEYYCPNIDDLLNKYDNFQMLLSGGKDTRIILDYFNPSIAFTIKHYKNDREVELCTKIIKSINNNCKHHIIDLFRQDFSFNKAVEDFNNSGFMGQPYYLWINEYQNSLIDPNLPLLSGGLGELARNEYLKKIPSLLFKYRSFRLFFYKQLLLKKMDNDIVSRLTNIIERDFYTLITSGANNYRNIFMYITRFSLNAITDRYRMNNISKSYMPLAASSLIKAALCNKYNNISIRSNSHPYIKNGVIYKNNFKYYLSKKHLPESFLYYRTKVADFLTKYRMLNNNADPIEILKKMILREVL